MVDVMLAGWMTRIIGLLFLLLGLSSAGWSFAAPPAAVPDVALDRLSPEARETVRLIHSSGPFPYEKDGVVFGNREKLLPAHRRGYYREYTVPTPGARDRGARRVVCGGYPPSRPEVCYLTLDHYTSFSRIVP